jgi:hypothetical protein
LGLTPSSRSRVTRSGVDEEHDPFAEFADQDAKHVN